MTFFGDPPGFGSSNAYDTYPLQSCAAPSQDSHGCPSMFAAHLSVSVVRRFLVIRDMLFDPFPRSVDDRLSVDAAHIHILLERQNGGGHQKQHKNSLHFFSVGHMSGADGVGSERTTPEGQLRRHYGRWTSRWTAEKEKKRHCPPQVRRRDRSPNDRSDEMRRCLQEIGTLKGHTKVVWAVAFSPDSSAVASGGGSGDNAVVLWDWASQQPRQVFREHTAGVCSVSFSADGHELASGSNDRTIVVRGLKEGSTARVLRGHADTVWSVCYSPTETNRLASASQDKMVKMWDTSTLECTATFEGHQHAVACVTFSPDGQTLATGSWDNTVRVWKVHGTAAVCVLRGHKYCAWTLAFMPDGQTLVSGSHDRSVRLWDLGSRTCIARLLGHQREVSAVQVLPMRSGSGDLLLASAGEDRMIKVWDLASKQCVCTWPAHEQEIYTLAAAGRNLVSGSEDRCIKLWRLVD